MGEFLNEKNYYVSIRLDFGFDFVCENSRQVNVEVRKVEGECFFYMKLY